MSRPPSGYAWGGALDVVLAECHPCPGRPRRQVMYGVVPWMRSWRSVIQGQRGVERCVVYYDGWYGYGAEKGHVAYMYHETKVKLSVVYDWAYIDRGSLPAHRRPEAWDSESIFTR